MQQNQGFTQSSANNMDISNDTNEILSRKKQEERKKLLLKIYKSWASEIIGQIETMKVHFSKIWLDIKDSIHRRWIEEFAIIFDEDWDDAPIDITLDNVDIYLSKEWEPIIQFDFDDILENEDFNMWHKIFLDKTLDEDGIFEESLFLEELKICAQNAINLMLKLDNK